MPGTTRSHHGYFGALSLAPFALLVLVFGGYALGEVIHMAFSHIRVQGGSFVWSGAGLGNFRHLVDDDSAESSLLVTALFVAVTSVTSVAFGTALALLVQRSLRFKALAQTVLLWPAIMAPVVVSLVWLLILSPNVGTLNKALATLGLPGQDWIGTSGGALACIVLVDVWHWTPLVFLLIYAALCGIDEEIVEAARCDGASSLQAALLIQLPLLLPSIAGAMFIRVVMGVKAFDEMYLLTNGGPNGATNLVSLYIHDVFFEQLNYGYGAAVSVAVVLLLAILIVVFVGLRRATAMWPSLRQFVGERMS